ncbi:hypothetical protein N9W57_01000 [Pseudomonadales bacterium]|nr:hypothetical protein [Pseudomonadales bacterium]
MKNFIIGVSISVLSSIAIAEGPSWTYASFGFVAGDSSDAFIDGNFSGHSFNASGELMDNIHARIDYSDVDLNDGISSEGYSIALGAHSAVTDNTDLVVEFVSANYDFEDGNQTDGYDSYGLNVGLRSMFSNKLELSGGVSFIDLESDADLGGNNERQVTIYFGGQYIVNENMGIGIDYSEFNVQITDDFGSISVLNVYARWSL